MRPESLILAAVIGRAVVKTLSPNFAFLAHHDARMAIFATQAEQQFAIDPSVTLIKLRMFAEVLAKIACAKLGQYVDTRDTLETNIDRLAATGAISGVSVQIFHDLRRGGNAAAHGEDAMHREALHQLRMARELAIWFQRTFGNNRKFEPGPFVPPPEPQDAAPTLHNELAQLRQQRDAQAAELARAALDLEALRRERDDETLAKLTAEQRAAQAAADAALWETLAAEEVATNKKAWDAQRAALQAELVALQAHAVAAPAQTQASLAAAVAASDAVQLDEVATRVLIDRQLRDAGWDVDTASIRYSKGVRPTKGKNLAIAEWPTEFEGKAGFADYVLFVGLTAIAVIEAKKRDRDVVSDLGQAKRYSRGYQILGGETLPPGGPWGAHGYRVPFLFATNGRPYLRQLETKSGVWFRDARRDSNHARALQAWYSPAGLLALLAQDIEAAQDRLEHEPMPYIDRDYQRNAILAAEHALGQGRREVLLAMATGTGKTRTCIGLCYRLLKTGRFRRILFLVDRRLLGEQTLDALKDLRLENLQTFHDIYNVKELKDIAPDAETRFHIATVQAMAMRVLGPHGDDSVPPPIDDYDCIIIDECHRGYLLDRELSERDFSYRDEADYISKYRRVLDYFDAAKIGLTATPALHTKEIFGAPVFTYSYREAVIDGFLVDHEPPIQIITQLATDGIHYNAKQEALVLDRASHAIVKEELPDEVTFEVENFNRQVITENFNRAVLRELVQHIDPSTEEKTLVFAVTDEHADLVVKLLKEALAERYGEVDDDAVMKITGKTDKVSAAMRQFRNERHPNIVVTVDLLTTGIDVPSICNLVFLRRVGSRILYEQMIGRATRLCDKINKERFRIFDAVDLYSTLQSVTDMKPVVVNPSITFTALAAEIAKAATDEDRQVAIEEFTAKLQRKRRHLKAATHEGLEAAAGMSALALLDFLRHATPGDVAAYLQKHQYVPSILDRATGDGISRTIISEHPDAVRDVVRGYGIGPDGTPRSTRPADYLDSFRTFVLENLNKLPALVVVTQRPRDLTRESLRELRLLLDQNGYGEAALQTAWREAKNEDIAATIIGHIRRAALGSPLVPYTERVDRAVAALRKANKFSTTQAEWLSRIAKQIKVEAVVDRLALDRGEFKAQAGGFTRLNKVFDGKLEQLIGELADEVWRDAG